MGQRDGAPFARPNFYITAIYQVILRGKPVWIILDRRISGVKEHKQVQRNGCGNAQHLELEQLIAKPGFNRVG
jgi:hypothetical protein